MDASSLLHVAFGIVSDVSVDITNPLTSFRLMWKQWVNTVLGLVVLATPFIGLSAAALMWTLAVAGIVIAVLAIWSAVEEPTIQERRRYAHQ